MTEEIIIDGINVAGCGAYKDKHCKDKTSIMFCDTNLCSNYPYCYYKQLKRLEQERNELKKTVENQKLEYEELQCDYNELEQRHNEAFEQFKEMRARHNELLASCEQSEQEAAEIVDELKQENKELKELIGKTRYNRLEMYESFEIECNSYRSALEEINRVIKLAHKVEDYLLGQDYTDLVDRIEKELEVLND